MATDRNSSPSLWLAGLKSTVSLWVYYPEKPTQDSFIERFNRTCQPEILNMYIFKTLNEVVS
ncbi:transposase [Vibrio fluvialis]|nr:transposase [Vibrio fluvialis]